MKQRIGNAFLTLFLFLLSTMMVILIVSAIISKEMNAIIVYWGPVLNPDGKMIYHPTWYFYLICMVIGGSMLIPVIKSIRR